MTTVALDLRMVQGRVHGIARYALELACRLPALEPGWRFVGITGPEGLPSPQELGELNPGIELVRCAGSFLSAMEQPTLAWTLASLRPALFHATSFSLPLVWPGKLVATLHDANHLVFPDDYDTKTALYYRTIVGPRARFARALITVSEFSRRELARELGLGEDRFDVTLEGVSSRFRPPEPDAVTRVRERHSLPERYVLAVGNPKPHKNLGVLRAFAQTGPVPLVLLAGPGARKSLGFDERTVELSGVDEADMPALYAGAALSLLPSVYEGFGFPMLESMAAGCPVVATRGSSLAELAVDAACLIDSNDPAEWSARVQALLAAPEERAELRERGLRRAAEFPWERCVEQTRQIYRRVLGSAD